MMKQIHQRLVLFLTFGLSATGAWAQAHMAVVQPDRILIGPEFVPRAQPSQQVLVVPAGQTVIAPPDATWDSIEVAGTFRIARDRDTVLRVINLFVLPGGTLDMGTLADPIPCERKVEIILRDVPLDTAKDPFQWGNGLLNFGKQTRVGCNKTAFVETTGSLAAGATSITLASAPINWAMGDELLIPDTATPPFPSLEPRREKTVTIAAISGVTVTLSKPLDFAHNNIVDPQGVVVLRPRVANLTRNIVWRSENPTGSRGHTVDIGHSATWDIRYNQNIGLGRTRNEPHDDTVLATQHVGTNERGRYAEHHHHVGSSPTSVDMGNVYVGSGTASPAAKWALVVHQTSDTLIERNITIDFPGAGFVTEDGYEVRNVFRGNLSSYNSGHAKDAGGVFFDAAGNVKRNCPGCEGTGFWLRGVKNTFEGNEAWNNFTVGFNLFNQAQPPGAYPSAPGAEPDTALHQEKDLPLAFVDNVAAANVTNGLEIWSVAKFPYRNLIAAHTLYRNIFAVSSQLPAVYLQNAKVICEVGKGSDGIHSSMGYVQTFDMEGGQIAGCAIGIQGGGGGMGMNIIGTVLQNELNIDMTSIHLLMKDVLHKPLAAYPHRYVQIDNGTGWNGTDPLPKVGISMWMRQRGSDLVVKNWQGTGQDFLLFSRRSLASNPAWYSAPRGHEFNTPVKGLTMQQSWDAYGLSYGGDVLKESDAVELDGIVNGLARAGLKTALGPPRAIVTFPTLRAPARLEGDAVRISAVLTGDPTLASDVMMISIDGAAAYPLVRERSDDRTFTSAHITPGIHEIKTWRTKKDKPKELLPGSEYVAHYCVGTCESTESQTPPPPRR